MEPLTLNRNILDFNVDLLSFSIATLIYNFDILGFDILTIQLNIPTLIFNVDMLNFNIKYSTENLIYVKS